MQKKKRMKEMHQLNWCRKTIHDKNFQHTRDKKNFLNIINYINDKL